MDLFRLRDGYTKYRIQPNYSTVRLGFSKLLGKFVKYVSTYTMGKKRSAKDLLNDFLYESICCGYSFECLCDVFVFPFSDFLYKSICVGNHNRIFD